MSTLWESWRSEFEALPALADEWKEEVAEEFIRDLQSLIARKRVQRDAGLKLANEIKYIHVDYADLLSFFGIEEDFLRWSAANCPLEELDGARAALGEWREVLQKHAGAFPPPEEKRSSYAAMLVLMNEAQSASEEILHGFRSLNACFAPRTLEPKERREAAAGTKVRVMAA